METWWVVHEVAQWAVRGVMLLVVPRRQRPVAAWAWLALIFLAPLVGLAAYLLLGDDWLNRRHQRKYRASMRRVREQGPLQTVERFAVPDPLQGPLGQTDRLVTRACEMHPVRGNAAEAISDLHGQRHVIERVVRDIDAARRHVHLLFYIYRDDDTGRQMSDALARAAGRGVKCRLVVDALGSWPLFRKRVRWLRDRGVEVRAVAPVNPLQGAIRMDLRNHRKLVVIDGWLGYMGSWNVADADYGFAGSQAYEELFMRLEGPIVTQLQVAFAEDWGSDDGFDMREVLVEHEERGDHVLQLLPSTPSAPEAPVRDVYLALLHDARERVIITSPYMVLDDGVIDAFRVAVESGVEVRLITPERARPKAPAAAFRAFWRELLDIGVHIHLHQDTVIHSKLVTIDDTLAVVGSANFDIRSFRLNSEVNLIVYGGGLLAELQRLQERYLKESRQVTKEDEARRSVLGRQLDHMAKLLSPLL